MAEIAYQGAKYDCRDSETVLDALLRQGVELPYSCRVGLCLICMLRATKGAVPPEAQQDLREALRLQGYFLACQCRPAQAMEVAGPEDADVSGRARVTGVERLGPKVCRLRLEPAAPLYYRAGQFLNLRREDGLTRSYSLASVPRLDDTLELHVKRLPGGRMSNWIFDGLTPGETLDIQGPNGACFYVPGQPDQDILLIGNGTGLAPLIGIARDALHDGHRGALRLYHGTRHAEGLYLHGDLEALAMAHGNFTYVPCLSGAPTAPGCRAGRAETAALADHPDLAGWRVYLCGYPPMVHAAKKQAYLAGAALDDIHADPFELRELRATPRD